AEALQVLDGGGVAEPGVGAAQVLRDARMTHGEAADVDLVDHRLVPGRAERRVALPVEAVAEDDALRDARGAVAVVEGVVALAEAVAEDRLSEVGLAGE